MKKVFLFLSLLLSLGMLCACSNDGVSSSLYNTWILESYGNGLNDVPKESKGYIYLLTFYPNGTYSGLAYGNEVGGEYTCKGKMIEIHPGYMTQVAFEGADPDKFFLEHLPDVYYFTITDTELKLFYSKDQYFKFKINNSRL
ncbi:MAG: META domain-containing protein [Prevotella sp.]|nr:META domain-containing protein [Prevotella sp.]